MTSHVHKTRDFDLTYRTILMFHGKKNGSFGGGGKLLLFLSQKYKGNNHGLQLFWTQASSPSQISRGGTGTSQSECALHVNSKFPKIAEQVKTACRLQVFGHFR